MDSRHAAMRCDEVAIRRYETVRLVEIAPRTPYAEAPAQAFEPRQKKQPVETSRRSERALNQIDCHHRCKSGKAQDRDQRPQSRMSWTGSLRLNGGSGLRPRRSN